jgi:hypothetical protein
LRLCPPFTPLLCIAMCSMSLSSLHEGKH